MSELLPQKLCMLGYIIKNQPVSVTDLCNHFNACHSSVDLLPTVAALERCKFFRFTNYKFIATKTGRDWYMEHQEARE